MGHERAARETGENAFKNHQGSVQDRLGKLEREIADAHDKHGKLEGQQANHKQTGDRRIDELERKVDREEGDRKGDVYDLRSLIGGDAYARAQADPRATSPKLNGGAPKAAPKKEVSTTTTKPHAAGETKLDVKNTQALKWATGL
jgi:TolA-binding protein